LVIELLKHGHLFTNYLKLQILAPNNNLRIGQDSEFAQFSPTYGIANVKIDQALTFGMPIKVFS
jgi:hypothetical protein